MKSIWATLFSIGVSIAWLLPNHYRPWATFHSDAWMLGIGWIALLIVVFIDRKCSYVVWPRLSVLAFAVAFVPWFQYGLNVFYFSGQAWVSSLYLLAFGLAIYVGSRWEQWKPGQLTALLFSSMLIAAVLSVWLQLSVWMGIQSNELTDIWSMGHDGGGRPYANMGQPNLLGSLLLMALVGVFWFLNAGAIGKLTASILVLYLTIGLVLVQSRTAQLSMLLLAGWLMLFRSKWKNSQLGYSGILVLGAYLLWMPVLGFVYGWLNGQSVPLSRPIGLEDLRLQLWMIFATALWRNPIVGYGMTEVTPAQVAVANYFPNIATTAGHSHNLYLDMLLWFGVPLGLLIAFASTWLLLTYMMHAKSRDDRIVQMPLMVLGVHAMLELPLHHAFFLLPFGMFVGVLSQNANIKNGVSIICMVRKPFKKMMLLSCVTALALFITVKDYFEVESAYTALRFELANIGVEKTGVGKPPDVTVLTQLRSWIWAARLNVGEPLAEENLRELDAITRRYPSSATVFRITKAFAINGDFEKAQYWADRWSHFMTQKECAAVHRQWIVDSKLSPLMDQVKINCKVQG